MGRNRSRFAPRYDWERLLELALTRWPTQRAVAKAAGLAEITLSTWARGVAEPNYESVEKLARLLGRKPEDFIVPDEDDDTPQPRAGAAHG